MKKPIRSPPARMAIGMRAGLAAASLMISETGANQSSWLSSIWTWERDARLDRSICWKLRALAALKEDMTSSVERVLGMGRAPDGLWNRGAIVTFSATTAVERSQSGGGPSWRGGEGRRGGPGL